MWRSTIDTKLIAGLILSVVLIGAIACSSAEEEAPAAPMAPTPDISAIIQQAMSAQPTGASSEDVAAAVQAAMSQQPGVTQGQVAQAIASALEDRPGITETQVGDAIARSLADRPGVTEGQVADAIASALMQQTLGLTEAQVGEAIAKALADRPGVSEADIAAAVESAVAKAVAQPVMAPSTGMMMDQKGDLRVALDIVGTPIYVNRNSPYPVNALPINFGFTEIMTGWQEIDGVQDCLKPLLAESWEINSGKTKVTINLRKGVLFRAAERDWGEMTAEDVVFSLNDTYIEASRHANNAEMATSSSGRWSPSTSTRRKGRSRTIARTSSTTPL